MTAGRMRAAAGLIVLVVVVAVAGLRDTSGGRDVSFVTPAAVNLLPGNQVNAGARKIGTVTGIEPVDRGRAARVKLRITDNGYWPLPADSKVEIRFGGTVSFSNRYILLTRGHASRVIPDGGEIARANVTTPVEIDSLIANLTPPVRGHIRALLHNGASALGAAAPSLHSALTKTPATVEAASGVLGDLTRNQNQLSTLLTSTGRVVDGVDRATPDLRVLLDGLARTSDAVASEQSQLRVALTRFPSALRQTRQTLALADTTLRDAGVLTDRLAPGISSLNRAVAPLTAVLAGVRDVAPGARRALDAVAASAPATSALRTLAGQTPRIGSVGRKATKALDCIRPYAPELVSFGSTWGDWMSPIDDRDHLVRATMQSFLPANYNSDPQTPAQTVKQFPGIEYGFPRPPGALAGQPWFQPQCGAGPDALNPSKDHEAADYAPDTSRTARAGGGK